MPPSTNELELRTQRISTRLFILSLSLALMILLLYTSLESITKTINVKKPTRTEYLELYSKYSSTLTCPCTEISIKYGKFLHVEYKLHQVCDSIFVTNKWISSLQTGGSYWVNDFRWVGPNTFLFLEGLCELIQDTISNSLIQFYSTQYVTASVTSLRLFQAQTQLFFNQFNSSITNSFLLSLYMIGNTTQANHLYSGLSTNYFTYVANGYLVQTYPYSYSNCNCDISSKCIEQSSIRSQSDDASLFNIPGFYYGCYVIESLLQSTLQCFYDQNCIDNIQDYLSSTSPINVTALDPSLPSLYSENSSIHDLLDKLMIEEWNVTKMYDAYYSECQPRECSYTIQSRNDVIYIITTLIGVVGGLTTVLKLVVPRLVKFVIYCARKYKMRIIPEISTIRT